MVLVEDDKKHTKYLSLCCLQKLSVFLQYTTLTRQCKGFRRSLPIHVHWVREYHIFRSADSKQFIKIEHWPVPVQNPQALQQILILVWQSVAGYVILELSFRWEILFDSLRIVCSPAAGVTPVTEPAQFHMDYLGVGWIIQQQIGGSLGEVSDIVSKEK